MREVQDNEAETQFSALLDAVERGETVVITRHGQAVARLVPESDMRQEERAQVIEAIREIGKRTGKTSLEEILAWRHEGHRF